MTRYKRFVVKIAKNAGRARVVPVLRKAPAELVAEPEEQVVTALATSCVGSRMRSVRSETLQPEQNPTASVFLRVRIKRLRPAGLFMIAAAPLPPE